MVVGCQPYAPAAFTPTKNSWYSFLLEAESTPGPQCDRKDFMSMKNPLTPSGIESATIRFVAQHLKHCATVVPLYLSILSKVSSFIKIWQKRRVLYMNTYVLYKLRKHPAEFSLEWEIFPTNVQKIKTHILCSITVSQKSCLWWDVEKKKYMV